VAATTVTQKDHQDHQDDGFYSAARAAEYLDISVRTVWKKCRKNELPHTRFGTRKILIPIEALRAYKDRVHGGEDGTP
jgi:excisionase family DNA binding protein